MNAPSPFGLVETLQRVGVDCLSGVIAAGAVAPVIASIDKAVVEKAAGKSSIRASLTISVKEILLSPFEYLSSFEFIWIWLVYALTYMAFNSIDSLCKIIHIPDVLPKLLMVTFSNMAASVAKDRAFAVQFGGKGKGVVRMVSLLLWTIRDVMTIATAFIFPPKVGLLLEGYGMPLGHAVNFAQFLCPIIAQIFLTPLHILGLDYYNHPDDMFRHRAVRVTRLYPSTAMVRMVRMGCAYGIGGIGNKIFRNFFNTLNEGANWDSNYA